MKLTQQHDQNFPTENEASETQVLPQRQEIGPVGQQNVKHCQALEQEN